MPNAFDNPNWAGGMFAPVDPLGQPTQFSGALTSRGNSLIGMGMGLLRPYRPWAGESPWTNALQGWEQGSTTDLASARQQQQMQMERARLALAQSGAERQANQWQQEFALRQKQFERGDVTDAQRAFKDIYGDQQVDPETKNKFFRDWYQGKAEGDWTVMDIGTPLDPKKIWVNKRTREQVPFDATSGLPPGSRPGSPPGSPAPDAPPPGAVTVVPGTTLYRPATSEPTTTGGGGPWPTTPTATATAPATAAPEGFRDNAFLGTLGPNMANIVKGVAEYEMDPQQFDAKDRTQILAAARKYRPDYNTSEYQKRGSPPSAEAQARIGLARGFLDRVEDIRTRIQNGEYVGSIPNLAQAQFGQGAPGQIRRAIDSGADALIRGLTGAGMSIQEASNYARRYQFSPIDRQATVLSKLDDLERDLRYVVTEMGKGRGGDDLLKDYRSHFGTTGETTPATPSSGRTGGAAVPTQNWVRDANGNLVRQ